MGKALGPGVVLSVGEKDTEPKTAEVPPLREKASHQKETESQRVKVRAKQKETRVVKVQRVDALTVAAPTMHPTAQREKEKARQMNFKMVVKQTHGDNRANREHTTQCHNPYPTGPREHTQEQRNATHSCPNRGILGFVPWRQINLRNRY